MLPDGQLLRFRVLIGLCRDLILTFDGLRSGLNRRSRPALPSTFGKCAVEERVLIPAAPAARHLTGNLVLPAGSPRASVIMLHGIGDRIEYWRTAQQWLAEQQIASLIFHYSGYPGSDGPTTHANLEQDVTAAYSWLVRRVPSPRPPHLLAFSLGTGLAVEVAARLQPLPTGLILAEPYTSLRRAGARAAGPFGWLNFLLPDIWRTAHTIRSLAVPLLILHSRGDRLFPFAMAEQLLAAARAGGVNAQLLLLDGFAHNAIYLQVPPAYWEPICSFILQAGPGASD